MDKANPAMLVVNLTDYEYPSNAADYSQYKLNGYHPVSIGEVFNNSKYVVIHKLGWVIFQLFGLCKSRRPKIISKQNYYEAAMDELDLF